MALDATEGDVDGQVRAIATRMKGMEGPLLPILHAVQDELGHVPQAALPVIADVLNLTAAEVHGVMSFYHDFRKEPVSGRVVKLCRSEACKAMGADRIAAALQEHLGIGWHETTADGAVTLEPVYCLGLCACAPAAMVGDTVLGRAYTDRLKAAIGEGGE